MIDLPTALYVISKVSFCCPQDVPAKALRILFLRDTLSATWLLCLLNDIVKFSFRFILLLIAFIYTCILSCMKTSQKTERSLRSFSPELHSGMIIPCRFLRFRPAAFRLLYISVNPADFLSTSSSLCIFSLKSWRITLDTVLVDSKPLVFISVAHRGQADHQLT